MKERLVLLLLCVIVVVAIVVLASDLREVDFRPGRTFSAGLPPSTPVLTPVLQAVSETPLWKLLLFWLVCLVNLVLFFYLLPPELRKKIVRQIFGFATGLLVLLLALRYRVLQLPELLAGPANPAGQVQARLEAGSGLPSFHPPPMSSLAAYLVGLFAVLAIFGFIGFIYCRWNRSQASRHGSLGAIGDIAEASLRNLAAGRDWGDVILQSYIQMSDAVSARRGLQRGSSATAREFADRLTHAGLPAAAIGTLTRLFETVRYGARQSSQSEVKEAVDCLDAILLACGTNP